jgi:hypothetical protein
MVILALLLISPAWADDTIDPFPGPADTFDIAMLNLGPKFGFHSNNRGAGGAPLTSHILLETEDNLAAESGAIITRDE